MKKLWLWSQNFFGRGMKQFMNQSSAINISLLCFMNQRAEHVRSSDRHLIKEALLSSQGHNDQKQIFNSSKMLLLISLLLHNTSPLR